MFRWSGSCRVESTEPDPPLLFRTGGRSSSTWRCEPWRSFRTRPIHPDLFMADAGCRPSCGGDCLKKCVRDAGRAAPRSARRRRGAAALATAGRGQPPVTCRTTRGADASTRSGRRRRGRRCACSRPSTAWSRPATRRASASTGAIVQAGLLYLFSASSATYSCYLAMTDAAARVLLDLAPASLRDRLVPGLTSRDPGRFITSGQWMTERTGGSDVGGTETIARPPRWSARSGATRCTGSSGSPRRRPRRWR
jgi:hypothetical protein